MHKNNTTKDLSYYQKNTNQVKKFNQAYYQANKERLKAKREVKEVKDRTRIRERSNYQKNKDKIIKHNVMYQKHMYSNNPTIRLKMSIYSRIRQAFKAQKSYKNNKTSELLGCSVQEAKLYIESLWLPGMSWENYTVNGWHIDHIKPVNTFDLTDPEQQKVCFHYTNLRPLWATDNWSRPKNGSDVIIT